MQLEELLTQSVQQHASDLHILPNSPPLLRIDGELSPIKEAPVLTANDCQQLIYSAMTSNEQKAYEKCLVAELAIHYPELGHFRLSAFHQQYGCAAVLRVIPNKVPTFDELSLPQVLKSLLSLPYGIILVTGPTGSGKTTTLAAMTDYINQTRASHIITIENPIEFIHQSKKSALNQLQVDRDTPDVATALRSALRQDPNVILLGEMRDLETVRLALAAAETGHLVMATLHASTAPIAISRIIDMFPTEEKSRIRNLLSETIQAVICQTLVKKIQGGRTAGFEIMLASPAIRNMIRQDKTAQMETAIQTSGDMGMCTLEQYLDKLVEKRIITTVVARNIATAREPFRLTPPPSKGKVK